MWRVLQFLLLVVLCIPAWIAIQVALQTYAPSPPPIQGVRAVIDAKLKGETWRVVAMDPQAQRESWQLTGLVKVAGEKGALRTAASERVFLADLRSTCARYGDPKCWTVESLSYADTDDFGADEELAEPPADKADRVKAVQTALKALGFDPGPLDGALGAKTRAAITAYLERTSPSAVLPDAEAGTEAAVAEPRYEDVMNELVAKGFLAEARSSQIEGDYHAALQTYAKARDLQPALSQIYYNSGIIYRAMGLPQLAIDEFDLALANKPDWELAHYRRGSAYYQEKQYLEAYGDYANGFGVRVLGKDYLSLQGRLADLGESARVGAIKLSHWAEAAWQKTARLLQGTPGEDKAGQAADDPAAAPTAPEADVVV